jgi:hypothetical protein
VASTAPSTSSFAFLDSDPHAPRVPSPDVRTMLVRTPRPRRASSSTAPRGAAGAGANQDALAARRRVSEGVAAARLAYDDDEEDEFGKALEEESGRGGSDSSLDIHTPLP